VTGQDPAAAAAQLDPDAQLDLLDRELARRRTERDAQAKRQVAQGGPCRFCGTTEGWERTGVGGWLQLQGAPVCHGCAADRGGLAGDDASTASGRPGWSWAQPRPRRGRATATSRRPATGMTSTWRTPSAGTARLPAPAPVGGPSGSGT
jgi:hypothetical protein